jgi:Amidohydrolase family
VQRLPSAAGPVELSPPCARGCRGLTAAAFPDARRGMFPVEGSARPGRGCLPDNVGASDETGYRLALCVASPPRQDLRVAVPHHDLVIRTGTVLTPGHQEIADVGINAGQIARLGGPMTGEDEIDAVGLLVLPGGIDAHVHLVCAALAEAIGQREQVWVDDFWTGSLAAFASGITTVGNMTFALERESMTAAVARDVAGASAEAAVDWFLHPVLAELTENTEAEIAALAADGHTSIKVFLSDPRFTTRAPGLARAVAAAGQSGSLTLMHCEDAEILTRSGQELIEAGRGAVRHFPDSRPVGAEVAAIQRAVDLVKQTNAPVYVVHLSSAAALDQCRLARGAGSRSTWRQGRCTCISLGNDSQSPTAPSTSALRHFAVSTIGMRYGAVSGQATSTPSAAITRRGLSQPSSTPP